MIWVLLSCLLVCRAGAAQAPPPFADLHLPGGAPPTTTGLGKLIHVLDGPDLHVWSASTRRWDHLPVGPGAVVTQTNDALLVHDGATWTGFGSTRGRFAPLAASPTAFVANSGGQNNDSILVVRDGTALHAFSGLTGRWTTRAITPSAAVVVQRHVAVLADNGVVAGLDAFSGTWRDLPVGDPVLQLSADGTAGVAVTASTVYGFSAARSAWSSAPALAGAVLSRDDDWVMLHDGIQALAFSGLTGGFDSVVTGPLLSTAEEGLFRTMMAPGVLHVFSAVTGAFEQTGVGALAVVQTDAAVALVADAGQVVAWSAPLGGFTPLGVATSATAVSGAVAAAEAQAGGMPHLYSALLGAWYPAPADVLPGVPPLSINGALLPTGGGFRAFSARTGAFVPLAAPAGHAEVNASSAPLVVWDPGALHVFDARGDRWLSAARSAVSAPNVQIWRTSVMVLDGAEVFGFGAQAGTLHRTSLPAEPVLSFRANSESAMVRTSTHVLGYSAVPEPASLVQFPEFRRVAVRGAEFRLHLRLPAGEAALLGYGAGLPVPLPVSGLGDLLVDPAGLQTVFLLPEPDADRAEFAASIPDDPALRGATVWFQALVAPAAGAPYLTEAATLWIG